MNPLEDFLTAVRTWRDQGAVLVEEAQVSAPHAVVAAFDADRFGALAADLSAQTTALTQVLDRLETFGTETTRGWSGAGGSTLAAAAAGVADELRPAAAELAAHAATAATAHQVLGEVLTDYRAAMAVVTGPLAPGLGDGQARQEIHARLELAAAAGRIASQAVGETVVVLHDSWRGASTGELVLAGER